MSSELLAIAQHHEKSLRRLVDVFLSENSKVNLSAFRTEEACWIGNILDSIAALSTFSALKAQSSKLKALDLGTGGGFPLLPLALSLPDAHLTGMDATQKKIDAISRIAEQMSMKNVQLVCGRAETLGHSPKYREQFDIVTARAVAEVTVNLEYCAPFVKPGGHIILWKSMNVEAELKASVKAQQELCCTLRKNHIYELPGDFGKRQLLVFEKTERLSEKYPRAIGIAKKKPIYVSSL